MLTDDFLRSRFGVNTKRIAFPPRNIRTALEAKQADPETVALALTTQEDLAGIAYAVTGARALRSSCIAGVVVHLLGGILGLAILTALMIAEEMVDTKRPLSALSEGLFLYPQYTENVRVRNKDAVLADRQVLSLLDDIRLEIGDEGRVLLRKSGTEPMVRVMVECKSLDAGRAYVARLTDAIRAGGHADE